jgi:hypothetical protein
LFTPEKKNPSALAACSSTASSRSRFRRSTRSLGECAADALAAIDLFVR